MSKTSRSARKAWNEARARQLSEKPAQPILLLSHRRDEMETDADLARETMRDLTEHFGPQQWESSLAQLDEPDKHMSDDAKGGTDEDDGCFTLQQVGDAIGVSREQARSIQEKALRKLRGNFATRAILIELLTGDVYNDEFGTPWRPNFKAP